MVSYGPFTQAIHAVFVKPKLHKVASDIAAIKSASNRREFALV